LTTWHCMALYGRINKNCFFGDFARWEVSKDIYFYTFNLSKCQF